MTVSLTTTKIQYTGDATNAALAVPFTFDDDDDLRVYSRVIASGSETLLTKGTHYSVSGGLGSTGTVTVLDGATNFPVTVTWTIQRVTPRTQLTDLISADSLAESGLESALDKIVRVIQEHDEILARTIRGPVTDEDAWPELPSSITREGHAITFDVDGLPAAIDSAIDPDLVAVSSFGAQLVGTATAATARALIDVDTGTLAARPASGTSVNHGYFARDVNKLYIWNGSAWVDLGIVSYAFGSLPSPASSGRVYYDTTRNLLLYDGATLTAIRAPLPRGHLAGLNLTRSTTSISVSAGECRMGTSSNRSQRDGYLASAFTKSISATWAAGSGSGGLAVAPVATNTWYHVFLIAKPDGSLDLVFDTSVECVNGLANTAVLAAGFTAGNTMYRRIGSVKTNGSSQIRDFYQFGDEFVWTAPVALDLADSAGTNRTGSDLAIVLSSVPLGIVTRAKLRTIWATLNSGGSGILRPGNTTIGANPSLTATPLASHGDSVNSVNSFSGIQSMELLTDTSQQIKNRASDATTALAIEVEGYIDARGRWD